MDTENAEIVTGLIQELLETLPGEERQNVIIFGSSAAMLNGVDLGREIGDLDLFVSDKTYNRLQELDVEKEEKAPGVFALKFRSMNVEILAEFPGVTFNEVFKNSCKTENSMGFRVGALDDLADWKRGQIAENPRPKDYGDLEKLNESINRRNSA